MGFEITLETTTSGGEYVRIKRDDYEVHIDRHEVSLKRIPDQIDQSEDQFIIYGNGNNLVGHILRWSDVDIPVSVDEDDLFDKLTEICISNSSITGTVDVNVVSPLPLPVNVVAPSPLPISGNVNVVNTPSVNATIVAPLPLPVTGTVNANATIVSPLPLPVSLISPLPVPITGTVTATISGNVLVTKEVGTLHKYTALTATPQNVFIGAGNVYGAVGINPNSQLKFLKLYDTLAAPTVGTTPVKLAIPLERDKQSNVIEFARGISFTNGCWAACTNDYDDASSTLSPKGIYINIIT